MVQYVYFKSYRTEQQLSLTLFSYLYRASFNILYYDQQMHNYFTNYHTPTCFDTIVSSLGSV